MRRKTFGRSYLKKIWLASGFVAFLFALLFFPVQPAFACTTTLPPKDTTPATVAFQDEIKEAEIIFEGTVLTSNMFETEILVKQYFKGQPLVLNLQKGDSSFIDLRFACPQILATGETLIFYARVLENQIQYFRYADTDNQNILADRIIKEVGQTPQTPSKTDLTNGTPNPLQTLIVQTIAATQPIFVQPGWPAWVFIPIILVLGGLIGFVAWKGAFSAAKGGKPGQ